MSDLKVHVIKAWTPIIWPDWDDYLAPCFKPETRTVIEQHRGHYIAGRCSPLGLHALHCTTCVEMLWER